MHHDQNEKLHLNSLLPFHLGYLALAFTISKVLPCCVYLLYYQKIQFTSSSFLFIIFLLLILIISLYNLHRFLNDYLHLAGVLTDIWRIEFQVVIIQVIRYFLKNIYIFFSLVMECFVLFFSISCCSVSGIWISKLLSC